MFPTKFSSQLPQKATWLRPLKNLIGRRERHVYIHHQRVHVEFRPVPAEHFEAFAQALSRRLLLHAEVLWADVHASLHYVVVACTYPPLPQSVLIQDIEEIEAQFDLQQQHFPSLRFSHPAHDEPFGRCALEIAADGVGTIAATVNRLVRSRSHPIEMDLTTLVAVFQNAPRARHFIEERLGADVSELALVLTNAVALGFSQGPAGPLIDMMHRVLRYRELGARAVAWEKHEPELFAGPCLYSDHSLRLERPTKLPPGQLENYDNVLWPASLGAFVLGFTTTQSIESAAASLFTGLPKAAHLGHEAFAAQLDRSLSRRGLLTFNPEVLRRLDLIDSCVVHDELLLGNTPYPAKVTSLSPRISQEKARARVAALFDMAHVNLVHRVGEWRLGPLSRLQDEHGVVLPEGMLEADPQALGLSYRSTLLAHVAIRRNIHPYASELRAMARQAGLRFIIATNEPTWLAGLQPDDMVPIGSTLIDTVRALQVEGRVVGLMYRGPSAAFAAADFGLGFYDHSTSPPWGADVMSRGGIEHAQLLLQACIEARTVARQSVQIAAAGAGMGAVLSVKGLEHRTTRQAMIAANFAALVAIGNGMRAATALDVQHPEVSLSDIPWHALEIDEVFAEVHSSAAGLTSLEAARRRIAIMPPPKRVVRLGRAVLEELASPLTPLLAAGATLSALIGSIVDAGLVGGVVGINAVIGATQKARTEKAILALESRYSQSVKVLRDGAYAQLDVSELVVGDVIEMAVGETVAADCRILAASQLEVDESSLTGESLPVRKKRQPSLAAALGDRSSMLYEGTSLVTGKAIGVVVAVGDATEARRAARIVRQQLRKSGVEARLEGLTEKTIPIALSSAGALILSGHLRRRRLPELLNAGVSLAVAAIPEGLPVIANIAQLASAKRLARIGALVSNPRAIEALGRANVACLDKTGTLTQGRIHLHGVWDGTDHRPLSVNDDAQRDILAAALRASPHVSKGERLSHLTDQAVVDGAHSLGLTESDGRPSWKRIAEIPFEPGRGYHAVLGEDDHGFLLSVKGAPEVILPLCSGSEGQKLLEEANALARTGHRVLVVAEKRLKKTAASRKLRRTDIAHLSFLGILTLKDPVRPEAAAAIANLQRAGVGVIMITGDHPMTAEQVATELRIINAHGILTGPELDSMDDLQLDEVVRDIAVYARVTPTHKVRIVRSLQRIGKIVAMTGDGANDAPAIRLADIGIAVGEHHVPTARDAADIVMTEGGIERIGDAILEGRSMWTSVRDAVGLLVGGNLGEIAFTLAAGLATGDSPLNARQLLLINLLTDTVPAMAVALRPPTHHSPEQLLSEGPESSLGLQLDRDIQQRAATTASGAMLAWIAARLLGSRERASTVGLTALVGCQLAQTLLIGRQSRGVVLAVFGSGLVLAAIVQTPGVSGFFGCTPLGPAAWLTALASSAVAVGTAALAPRAAQTLTPLAKDAVRALRNMSLNITAFEDFQNWTPAAWLDWQETPYASSSV